MVGREATIAIRHRWLLSRQYPCQNREKDGMESVLVALRFVACLQVSTSFVYIPLAVLLV